MRHRVYGKHLGRNKNQRTALFKGLVRSLILHESINTTSAKSKAIKGLVDRLIVKAKANTNPSRQFIQEILPQKDVSKKLLEEVAPRYKTRVSGFTQVVKLGTRAGDGAMIVKMSLIGGSEDKQSLPTDETSEGQKISEASLSEDRKVIKSEKVEEKKPARRAEKKEVKK